MISMIVQDKTVSTIISADISRGPSTDYMTLKSRVLQPFNKVGQDY